MPGPVSVPGVRLRVAVVPGLRRERPHLPQHGLRELRRGGHQLRRTLPLLPVRYIYTDLSSLDVHNYLLRSQTPGIYDIGK